MTYNKILTLLTILVTNILFSQNKRARDYGIEVGVLKTGKLNAITLFAAKTKTGRENYTKESLPIDDVIKIMKKYNSINTSN
ncbi:hypothetical protein [Polaribacter sp. Asnod1-A03]|uniref:hypothetical protein n=1 Tax=Polaribacter sp. Asnod1-A03 TaxID=3160581 RepID=UPI00386757D4